MTDRLKGLVWKYPTVLRGAGLPDGLRLWLRRKQDPQRR